MRYLPVAALAALALSGCVAAGLTSLPYTPPAPATIADQTVLDEKAGILAESAYTAAARAGATAVAPD